MAAQAEKEEIDDTYSCVGMTSNMKGKLGIPVNQSILRKILKNLERKCEKKKLMIY